MSPHNIRPWIHKALMPIVNTLAHVPPDIFAWAELALSIACGLLLFLSFRNPPLTILAVPCLLGRLALDAMFQMVNKKTEHRFAAREVLKEVSDRLGDVAVFLGATLPNHSDSMLGFLAIICMLMVSFVGILGKAAGVERIYIGVLGKYDRMLFLMVACVIYAMFPDFTFRGYSVFDLLFMLFIPLASITLLQRLDMIFCQLSDQHSSS